MADLAKLLPVAATALSVGANIFGGSAANSAAKSEAAQLDYQAGQQRAAAQRQAEEQRRHATLANSRLQAVAGGGGGDVTAVNLAADLAGEGELRALTALYEGEDRAIGMEAQAAARRRAGSAAATAGYLDAASTLVRSMKKPPPTPAVSSVLSSGKSMFDKYGSGGFDATRRG